MKMRKRLLIPLLLPAVFPVLLLFAAGCRENSFRDNELVRRVRLRNTPEALSDDLFAALAAGNAERLDALSTPRVRSMLRNEFALLYPALSFDEAMTCYSASLKEKYKDGAFSEITLTKDENGAAAAGSFVKKDGTPSAPVSFRLVRDEHGNWKNDTRL